MPASLRFQYSLYRSPLVLSIPSSEGTIGEEPALSGRVKVRFQVGLSKNLTETALQSGQILFCDALTANII